MGKILVVDDDTDICETFDDILRGFGYEVDCTYSYADALTHVAKDAYCLVICDVGIHENLGALLDALHKYHTGPVLLISGSNLREAPEGTRFLRKPIRLNDLRSALLETVFQRPSA